MKTLKQEINARVKRRNVLNYEYYVLRPILGNFNWCIFYLLLGGREVGKSYAVTNFFIDQFVNKDIPFYWMRLTDRSAAKLLVNNAEKLIDPDLRRKYNLDIKTKGNSVYRVLKRSKSGKNGQLGQPIETKLMARVVDLSTFYNDKGSGYFDKDFLNNPKMAYNICLDEMNREKNERKTFDIVYAFVNQLENLVRSTKQRIRVFMIGNTLEEASDLLCAFNFIPEEFGIYKLKKKRAVIEYIEPSEKYLNRRKGTIADILMPNASTFTNKIDTDTTLITKERLIKPEHIVKFSKDKSKWFVIWNSSIITQWKGQTNIHVIAMRPYLDEQYIPDSQKSIIARFDNRDFKFRDLITFKMFQKELELLKPRK